MNPRSLARPARLFITNHPHNSSHKISCKQQRQHRADSRGAPAAAAGGGGSRPPFHGPPGGSGGSGGSSGSGPGGGRWSWGKWTLIPAAAATLLGGVAHAFTASSQVQLETLATARSHHKLVDWVQQLEEDPSTQKASCPLPFIGVVWFLVGSTCVEAWRHDVRSLPSLVTRRS